MAMSQHRHGTEPVVIGKVVSVNFPRRQLRVLPKTDHPERFTNMRRIVLQTSGGELKSVEVEDIQILQKGVLITLADACPAEEIAAARNARVVVSEKERHPLEENEYYIDDLIGMQVADTSGRVLGRLYAVYRTGANDVYELRDTSNRHLMVPAVKERILSVDLAKRVLTVNSEGLF